MKLSRALLSFVLMAPAAWACGTVSCYDYCTSSFVNVTGDRCTSEYDFNSSCYRARGECGGGAASCLSSISCYDYCTSSFVSISHADTCTSNYDFNQSCYRADAYCSH